MGRNLARNFARHGYATALHNRTTARTDAVMAEFGHEGTFVPSHTAQEFVASLERPRRIIMMVKAGGGGRRGHRRAEAVPGAGDIVIDGGNSLFTDTDRRERRAAPTGAQVLRHGGVRRRGRRALGPSIMPGGDGAYAQLGPCCEIAAKADSGPCVTYVGQNGAGHFVKMVHNGIEYGDMQLIAEAYDLLRHGLGLSHRRDRRRLRRLERGRSASPS